MVLGVYYAITIVATILMMQTQSPSIKNPISTRNNEGTQLMDKSP